MNGPIYSANIYLLDFIVENQVSCDSHYFNQLKSTMIMNKKTKQTQSRYGQIKSSLGKPFENCWSLALSPHNYDALDDPHAAYYFSGRSMKKHLLSLRKSIKAEGKHSERKTIETLITQRMQPKEYQPARQYHKKLNISASNKTIELSQVPSFQNRRKQRSSLHNPRDKIQTIALPGNYNISRQNKTKFPSLHSKHKRQTQTLIEEEEQINQANQKDHVNFIKFLSQRKKQLKPPKKQKTGKTKETIL